MLHLTVNRYKLTRRHGILPLILKTSRHADFGPFFCRLLGVTTVAFFEQWWKNIFVKLKGFLFYSAVFKMFLIYLHSPFGYR